MRKRVMAALLATGVASGEAVAQERRFDIPPQPLQAALSAYAQATGQRIAYPPELAAGRRSPGVSGTMEGRGALARLLAGTGLVAREAEGGAVTLAQAPPEIRLDAGLGVVALPGIEVTAQGTPPTGTIGSLPPAFPGGQVATGARIGALGNRNIFDTPFNVVPFTRELAENQQARTLGDVLRNDPSIQLGQSGGGLATDDVFAIRGFLLGSFATLYDGLPGLNYRTPAMELIERVEVFRGPTALVSGSAGAQGIGGMVNLIPKRAPDTPITSVTTRYISQSVMGIHTDVARRFGPDNAFGVRINAVRRGGETHVAGVEQQRTVLGLAADWRGDRARVVFDLDYQHDENDGYANSLFIEPNIAVPRLPSNRTYFWQPWAFLDQEKVRMALRAEYDIAPDWTIGVAYGRRSVNERFIDTTTTIIDAAGRTQQDALNGASYTLNQVVDAAVRGIAVTGPVRHQVAFGATEARSEFSGSFVAGPTFFSSIFNPVVAARPAAFEPTPSVPGRSSLSVTRSYFLADELSILDERLLLTLGLRQVQVENSNFNASTGTRTSRYSRDALTPSAGIVVKPAAMVSLYANYQQGLEPGGQAPSTARNAGELLEPLIADAYETGVRVDFGRLGATLGVFQISRNNTFVDPATNIFAANGRQVNRGIEFYAFGQPLESVRLIGGATLLDARAKRTAGGTFDGNRPIGQPEWTARAYAEWDTSFVPGLTLTGGVAYTAGQYLDLANTQRIAAWTRFDIGARYAFEVQGTPMTARFAVENLADTRYWSAVDRGAFWVAPPRTYLFSLNASF